MATMPPHGLREPRTSGKPAAGRPALFTLLLAVAALGVLGLLVVAPTLALPLVVTAASALIGLMGVAWAVAGPRL